MNGGADVRQVPNSQSELGSEGKVDRLLAGLVAIISRRIAITAYSDAELAKETHISRSTINGYRHGDATASGINWRNVWPLMDYLQIDAFSAMMCVLCLEDPAAYHDPAFRNISYCSSYLARKLTEIVSTNESGVYRSALAQLSPKTVEGLAGLTFNHVETRLRSLASADDQMAAAA